MLQEEEEEGVTITEVESRISRLQKELADCEKGLINIKSFVCPVTVPPCEKAIQGDDESMSDFIRRLTSFEEERKKAIMVSFYCFVMLCCILLSLPHPYVMLYIGV